MKINISQLSCLRLGSCSTMEEDNENRITEVAVDEEQEKKKLDDLVTELKTENGELTADRDCKFSQLQDALATVERLDKYLEENELTSELERLRMVDKLREEHQEALKREQAQVDIERERIRSFSQSFETEERP